MIHSRQSLPLGLKPGDYLPRVHPDLDDLHRYFPVDWLLLLGHEHDSATTLPDLLQQTITGDFIPI
jgi:hypothetical protein